MVLASSLSSAIKRLKEQAWRFVIAVCYESETLGGVYVLIQAVNNHGIIMSHEYCNWLTCAFMSCIIIILDTYSHLINSKTFPYNLAQCSLCFMPSRSAISESANFAYVNLILQLFVAYRKL